MFCMLHPWAQRALSARPCEWAHLPSGPGSAERGQKHVDISIGGATRTHKLRPHLTQEHWATTERIMCQMDWIRPEMCCYWGKTVELNRHKKLPGRQKNRKTDPPFTKHNKNTKYMEVVSFHHVLLRFTPNHCFHHSHYESEESPKSRSNPSRSI